MIISTWTQMNLVQNITLYYYQFEYMFYEGYKSTAVNNAASCISFPIDAFHLLVGYCCNLILIEAPQVIYNSRTIIYFGLHEILQRIDDYLVPN